MTLGDDAFVFSLAVDGSEHLKPDSVSQRYARLATRLGLSTTIHKLRHYSATELISAGVDVRTVAGRLGHGGGGMTTLKVYAAWVSESDQRAATSLFDRLPARPDTAADAVSRRVGDADSTYLRIAAELRTQIATGELPVGGPIPTHKQLAEQYGISAGTAHRVTTVLSSEGLVEVSRGRRARVLKQPPPSADAHVETVSPPTLAPALPYLPDTVFPETVGEGKPLLDLEIRRLGHTVKKLTTEADPKNARDLRQVFVHVIKRAGQHEAQIAEYEMDIRYSGEPKC
jgi:DNA-binding transcriptional regulator YhcF (GntR family)